MGQEGRDAVDLPAASFATPSFVFAEQGARSAGSR
jgi:hypothetical protein